LRIRAAGTVTSFAFEFLILTAARSGEVLNAAWHEVDVGACLWTVPSQRMKAMRSHRVPLSSRALEILAKLAEPKTSEFIFPGHRSGKPLSNMAFTMYLRRAGLGDVTPHGFRSAFRDWVGDATGFPREVAEAALAHVIGDKAEQAYRRSDALDKRRELMKAWAAFCEPKL
jgi:integrase